MSKSGTVDNREYNFIVYKNCKKIYQPKPAKRTGCLKVNNLSGIKYRYSH